VGEIKFVPKNEMQTREWFTSHIAESKYDLLLSQGAFPDYVLGDSDGKEYRVEVEYKSANFIYHGHDPQKCDFVLCWIHNIALPLKVLELSTGKWHESGEVDDVCPYEEERLRASRKNAVAKMVEKKRRFAEAISGDLHERYMSFMMGFAADLKAQSTFLSFVQEDRLKLLEETRLLISELRDVGIDVGDISPRDLFKLIVMDT